MSVHILLSKLSHTSLIPMWSSVLNAPVISIWSTFLPALLLSARVLSNISQVTVFIQLMLIPQAQLISALLLSTLSNPHLVSGIPAARLVLPVKFEAMLVLYSVFQAMVILLPTLVHMRLVLM